jgi:predicted regulator of Ras-like GTPase activity (Roadblock/LC7/MglB family)
LSYAYRQDLNWLVSDFTARVPDVAHAAVVSADGVPLSLSDEIPPYFAEQLAAITSGLASLMQGAARIFEAGMPTQALVEMAGGLMIIKAISDGSSLCVLASPDCDTELVSYEMSLLVEAAGEVLSPALRGDRQRPMPAGSARDSHQIRLTGLEEVARKRKRRHRPARGTASSTSAARLGKSEPFFLLHHACILPFAGHVYRRMSILVGNGRRTRAPRAGTAEPERRSQAPASAGTNPC